MTIYKAIDQRPAYFGRLAATITPVTRHRTHMRHWRVDWEHRTGEFFGLLHDAKAFVERFAPVRWVKEKIDEKKAEAI